MPSSTQRNIRLGARLALSLAPHVVEQFQNIGPCACSSAHPDQPFVPANASNFIIHSAEHSTYTHISLTPFCIHQYSIITFKENEKETSFDKNSHKQGKNLLGKSGVCTNVYMYVHMPADMGKCFVSLLYNQI